AAGRVLFVTGAAGSFGWPIAYLPVPSAAVDALSAISDNTSVILALLIVVLLILGTFMDLAPLIIICTPIFLPVAKAFGVDPVHFGVILILNAGIGLITPPVGSVLCVGTAIGQISVTQALRTIWPFYFAALTVLLIVVYVPQLSLWLPALPRAGYRQRDTLAKHAKLAKVGIGFIKNARCLPRRAACPPERLIERYARRDAEIRREKLFFSLLPPHLRAIIFLFIPLRAWRAWREVLLLASKRRGEIIRVLHCGQALVRA